ncbi:hypothetical protein SLS57_003698 [Botryosphaeria dothidea]
MSAGQPAALKMHWKTSTQDSLEGDQSVERHQGVQRPQPATSNDKGEQDVMESSGPRRDSLIVRLMIDRAAEKSPQLSLTELVDQESTIQAAREAGFWSVPQKSREIPGFGDYKTLQKSGMKHYEAIDEQTNVHLILSAMESDDNEPESAPEATAVEQKIRFASLSPVMRYTIIANIFINAHQERFQNPHFPIQQLLHLSTDYVIRALRAVETMYIEGKYPKCLSSRAMEGHFVKARRFLLQQDWPRRFLKAPNLRSFNLDRADVKLLSPYAPAKVSSLGFADLQFFGYNPAIWGKRNRRRNLSVDSSTESPPRQRARIESALIAAGAMRNALHMVEIDGRQEQSAAQAVAPAPDYQSAPHHSHPASIPSLSVAELRATIAARNKPAPGSSSSAPHPHPRPNEQTPTQQHQHQHQRMMAPPPSTTNNNSPSDHPTNQTSPLNTTDPVTDRLNARASAHYPQPRPTAANTATTTPSPATTPRLLRHLSFPRAPPPTPTRTALPARPHPLPSAQRFPASGPTTAALFELNYHHRLRAQQAAQLEGMTGARPQVGARASSSASSFVGAVRRDGGEEAFVGGGLRGGGGGGGGGDGEGDGEYPFEGEEEDSVRGEAAGVEDGEVERVGGQGSDGERQV